jgi:hypothetical protein
MSSLQVDNIQTYNSNPPVIKNVSGTEVGTFCRAWVNFNGTGVVAIRASFNVSSITDNGTGSYTVNFTSALADANHSAVYGGNEGGSLAGVIPVFSVFATTGVFLNTYSTNLSLADKSINCVAIFR